MRLTKHPITLAVASAIALATGAAAAAGPAQQAPTLHAPADVDGGARIIVKYRAGTAEERDVQRRVASMGSAVSRAGVVRSASARGSVEAPGRNVAQKAGLNRSILDAAPAAFLHMLRYKAEEAGSEYLEANTRRLKPSQRCPDCGTVRKKGLSDRQHDCSCGCSLGRDQAAALVLLRWGLEEVTARAARIQPGNGHPAGTVGVSAAQAA